MLFYTQSAFVFHHHHGYKRLSIGLRCPLSVVWDLHTHQFGETQEMRLDALNLRFSASLAMGHHDFKI